MISAEEAKLAWANGEVVEYYRKDRNEWFEIRGNTFVSVFDNAEKLRLKPRTITINGVEVPAPFNPKVGDTAYCLKSTIKGYEYTTNSTKHHSKNPYGWWRTESDIEQVVAALRSIFNDH